MQKIFFVSLFLANPLCLELEIRPIKCVNISSLSLKNPNKTIRCGKRARDCPVFEVKAKINVSVPSDVINRSKSIDYSTNGFRLVVHSEARTMFDDITKNQPSNTWISWVNAQMLYFRLSRE